MSPPYAEILSVGKSILSAGSQTQIYAMLAIAGLIALIWIIDMLSNSDDDDGDTSIPLIEVGSGGDDPDLEVETLDSEGNPVRQTTIPDYDAVLDGDDDSDASGA